MKASLTVLALTPLALAFPSLGQNLLVNGNFESEPNRLLKKFHWNLNMMG
jgi:hypothetical protein